MKTTWSTRLKGTARQPLGDALDGVLSGLIALDARVARHPLLTGLGAVRSSRTAPLGRLREVLDRDRALVAAGTPLPSTSRAPTPSVVAEPIAASRVAAPVGAFATPAYEAPGSLPSVAPVTREVAPAPAIRPDASAATSGAAEEPIRTRTMARLLAAQGHPARALAIYDALMATDDDPSLRAEADRLRER